MKTLSITTSISKLAPVTVTYESGETLLECAKVFGGEDKVLNMIEHYLSINIKQIVRSGLNITDKRLDPLTQDELQTSVDAYEPGLWGTKRQTGVAKVEAAILKLPVEDRKLLASILEANIPVEV